MPPPYHIDQRQLMVELAASDPILKRVADETLRKAFFDPAVAELKAEFAHHPVTNEIAGGAGAPNVSRTLEGDFRDKPGDEPPNLWGFIGIDAKKLSPEEALAPITERLDPSNKEGPKMTYRGRDKDKLNYNYVISAPDEEAIYNDERGHFFWAPGLSWIQRIERGIPGIAHFLNVNRSSSRSTGGIQVDGVVRSGGRFRPTSYLTKMFNNFLRRAAGREGNGRRL